MADSTVSEVSKMKVVDLRKELKTRGLPTTGDKTELVARLQAAMAQANDSNDEHGDINLDSDIDSEGVLEDEDDKSQEDILDDSAVDTLHEELALADHPAKAIAETKPSRILKRKITAPDTTKDSDNKNNDKTGESNTKKIVLNRTISVTSSKPAEEKSEEEKTTESPAVVSNKVKITCGEGDTKTQSELRAKRFGLPIQMTEAERKEARMKRFGQSAAVSSDKKSISSAPTPSLTENLDKLKKRAERFGQSVSKIMTDIENKEKLEKRKAKYAAA